MTSEIEISSEQMFDRHLMVRDLGCIRSGMRIFSSVGFSLAPADALLVSGPNGAGKSSLLRVLGGLIEPADGSISFAPIQGAQVPVPEASHLIGHLEAIKPGLSLFENLAFWIGLLGDVSANQVRARAKLALTAVNLAHLIDRPARFLSAGQKRRLALSRLVASPRALWLLDEPTLGLDTNSQQGLARLLAAHRAQGGIVIVTSHQPIDLPGARTLDLGHSP